MHKSKKYTISFNDKKEINNFKKEGLEIISVYEDKVTVVIQNNIKDFIKILSKYDIVDIDEEHQNLESIFMEYYGGKEND